MSDTEYPKVVIAEDFNGMFANLYAIKWAFLGEGGGTHTLITNII